MVSVTAFILLVVSGVVLASERKAVVQLQGSNGAEGSLLLVQPSGADQIHITGEVRGLSANKNHGFHVHEKGDLSDACKGAGGHYNPFKKNHGAPNVEDRHVGDLGNIFANDGGVANVDIWDKQVTLFGEHSVLGRAFVVHEDPDDLGKGGFSDSLTTGHAGARVACGVIGIA